MQSRPEPHLLQSLGINAWMGLPKQSLQRQLTEEATCLRLEQVGTDRHQ